jgi:leucyl aminopeptidase
MEVNVVVGGIQEQEGEAIVVNLFEGVTVPDGATGAVDKALDGAIRELIAGGDFSGKAGETAVLYPGSALPARRVILVGLGKREEFDVEDIRRAAAAAAKKARDLRVSHLHTIVHGAGAGGINPQRAAEAVALGTLLALYRYDELKTEEEDGPTGLQELTLVEFDAGKREALESGARTARGIAEGVWLTRDLVNCPANLATPTHLAETARELAEEHGLSCCALGKEELEEEGMGLLLGVNRAGGEPPYLIVLEHNAGQEELPTVVLVGKGITFDTGGISIKPSKGMERMKGDMGGAAVILGTLLTVALLDLPLHVVGLAPVTENMPGPDAIKPGDVLRSRKGLTVEVLNTDAEGRLILGDALSYAGEFDPDAIVDIATLTGGRIVALGKYAAAVMGNDELVERLEEAGEETGERVWELPLFKEYGEYLKSDVADVKNVGGREASSITAAFFLSKFPPEDVPWAHLDIAGLAFTDAEEPYTPKGATGFGLRLLVEMLRHWNEL